MSAYSDNLAAIDRCIIALDGMDERQARATVDSLRGLGITWFKIGKSLISQGVAMEVAKYILARGGKVFWDNKDIDILNTLQQGAQALAGVGMTMFNVMASIGVEKMKAVCEAAGDAMVIGVTVLTDMNDDECMATYGRPVNETVCLFSSWCDEAGMSGTVSSAADLENLAQHGVGTRLIKVTPAIRPSWSVANEQKRIITPALAVQAGADLLVLGRAVTAPPDEYEGMPIGSSERAVQLIIDEINAVVPAA